MSFLKTTLLALIIGLMPSMVLAAPSFTDAQKAEVEAIVRELLTKKEPEIIIKAAEVVQGKMEEAAVKKGEKAITENQGKLLDDPMSPVGGNPKGDVTIVEFFDYSCGYCKMAQGHVEKLLSEDKNVRIIYKEYAILGQASMTASQAALASISQGKYVPFHNALMESKGHLNESIIFSIAKNVGLDVDKLKSEMGSKKVKQAIADNHALAESMNIHGTPSFIIGGKLYPGALPLEQLKKIVQSEREAAKK